MYILETKNLTKYFGTHKALDDVSLNLEQGGVYGLMGPNGAGKTTFLRLVNNVLLLDSGEILFQGAPMNREIGHKLGYMAEERGLYAKMSVEDQIIFFGQLRGGKTGRLRQVMREYMEIFEMPDSERRRQVKELSKGNQQKVQIISTLVHEPELVMLDEPFSGFDPINGALLTEVIQRLKERGTTIVLSSHNMAALEDICSSVAMIDHGKLLLSGPLIDIKRRFREHIFHITVSSEVDYSACIDNEYIEYATLINSDNDSFTYELKMIGEDKNNILIEQTCKQSTLISFNEVLPTLNDLFIRFARKEEEPVNL